MPQPNVQNQTSRAPVVPLADIKAIICDAKATKMLVEKADDFGKHLKGNNLTTSQIRAIFGEVRQIQAQWNMGGENRQTAVKRLFLLKPKMAYRARKEQGYAVKDLVDVLDPALNEVVSETNDVEQNKKFTRFVEFFEAILAYHKAYGGK